MSLILDALRQSKQRLGPVTADEVPTMVSGTQTAKRSFVLAALLVCTIFGAGAVALWQRGAAKINGSDDALPNLSTIPTVQVPSGRQLPPTVEPSLAPESFEISVPLSRSRDSAPEPSQRVSAESQPTAGMSGRVTKQIASLHHQMWADAASADEATQPVDEEESSDSSNQHGQPVQSIAPTVDLATALERAARELGESALSPHPTPLLENLSQQQKDQIPMIVYSEHNYAPQGLASVMLNGKRLQSGQRADTVEVIDILRDSVILSVEGVEFRLKALNTWVNL